MATRRTAGLSNPDKRNRSQSLFLDRLEDRILLTCSDLPNHSDLTDTLAAVVEAGGNGGLANDMWATIVDRDGKVCAVTFSGENRGEQWLGSRVISAQKANTANAFSLPEGAGGISGLALSTANLYAPTQPGGSLFGLQESNPVDVEVAYRGSAVLYGHRHDPMVERKIGGVNVFGGGVGLYDDGGELVGALGISGDTSCTDHIVAWKVRDGLELDYVPVGVSSTGDDNIIFDATIDPETGHAVSASGFGSPTCGFGEEFIAASLPVDYPVGNVKGAIIDVEVSRDHLRSTRSQLPNHRELRKALASIVAYGGNSGLSNDMWATIVDRDGVVRAVAFSGESRDDQWSGSRVISAQKANTANAFSLPAGSGGIDGLAISTGNLFSAVQPGGSLFGLQESNPVDTDVAYRGSPRTYGQSYDPMVGHKIGGVNVFGGGVPLYNDDGQLIGAVGVSGDTSCADHTIAWKLRDKLGLDYVPAGVSPTGDDNIVYDTTVDIETGHTVSAGGFGHAPCGFGEQPIAELLPATHPVGSGTATVPDIDPGRPDRGPHGFSRDLPRHDELRDVLTTIVDAGDSGGLGNDMWATVVDRNGIVRAVAFTGEDRGDQWLGSRVISAQKANTANAFSLPSGSGGIDGLSLSSANLYSPTQPGGSLFGLQESNPVDTDRAYRGSPRSYGQSYDPMVGRQIGGVNVFGGGLALYNSEGDFIGAIGVSGDTSCTDHVIAWKVRDALNLDNVLAGVSGTGDDNLILDTVVDVNTGHTVSAGGFGHPACGFGEDAIIAALPASHPIGGMSGFVSVETSRADRPRFSRDDLPSHAELRHAVQTVVVGGANGGLANDMWATVVDRDGVVRAVAFSGDHREDLWAGSRVISAQKASTANAFSLPSGSMGASGLALSTANLYSVVQPGGSLFGLQESNPVDSEAAYRGNARHFGERHDPLVGHQIGGVNVFGGGLALYNSAGEIVGAIGLSGDTSCADHIVAWRVRDILGLDHIPVGVSGSGDDNIIFDSSVDPATGHSVSPSGFGHPTCGFGEEIIANAIPTLHPVGDAAALVALAAQTQNSEDVDRVFAELGGA